MAKRRRRRMFTAAESAEVWDRWQRGEGLKLIGLKYDVQIRGRSEHMQQRPESERLTTVFGQAEVDFHVLDAGIESFRRDCC